MHQNTTGYTKLIERIPRYVGMLINESHKPVPKMS